VSPGKEPPKKNPDGDRKSATVSAAEVASPADGPCAKVDVAAELPQNSPDMSHVWVPVAPALPVTIGDLRRAIRGAPDGATLRVMTSETGPGDGYPVYETGRITWGGIVARVILSTVIPEPRS